MKNILFLPRFCYIFRTLVLPFCFFLHSNSLVCLDAESPFPYKKSSGLTRLRKTLIEAIVFGPFSSEGERCDIYGHTGEIIHMGSSEACLWTSLVDYIFECGLAFFRLVFSKHGKAN